jgi:hypothetical protein
MSDAPSGAAEKFLIGECHFRGGESRIGRCTHFHMKKYLLLASIALSPVFGPSSFAQDGTRASADTLFSLSSNVYAKTGMSRDQLVEQFGAPSEKLSENLWAYFDFRGLRLPLGARGDTLVVVFTNDNVSLLRFTERALVEAAIAKLRSKAKSSVIATR